MSTTKQCAIKLIEGMSDEKVLAFIHLIADENELARIETELAENDPMQRPIAASASSERNWVQRMNK